ncbi:HAMP domain-containing sensor histidine kinase [Bacillus haynesii]|uniref:HAMP domain-containing sensor histidine kinase n=1 Tax=Bacillus haynesii TaxID=1925021 RepID=UPI001F60FE74|nr:HAMP domain-containing sensor histidine kinase [Bacillus haynesii]MCI4128737.1 HAMP domain-containing histidine kinase [Bacillus haynesii]
MNILRKLLRKLLDKWSLSVLLVFYVFIIMIASFVLQAILSGSLSDLFSFMKKNEGHIQISINPVIPIGVVLAFVFSKRALRPLREVIEAVHKISQGDFNTRLKVNGIAELRELELSFNKMAQELSSIESLRSDFINDFSHQFKTPIMSIRGFTKLLQEGGLSDEEKEDYLQIIVNESERLAKMSTNILNLTKYENTNILSSNSTFRLDEQIRGIILLMEPKWMDKNLSLIIELEEITFVGNADLSHEIWMNLIDNAIKYSYSGSVLTISLKKITKKIKFTIQDEGIGMDEETKKHLFDKFYRGHTVEEIAGNGLGLPIVKRVVSLFNGHIEFSSEMGKGSIFTVTLPQEKHD